VCAAQTLASRQNNGVSNPKDVTVIGTTNPFFMKVHGRTPVIVCTLQTHTFGPIQSLSHWPNALIFPFLEPPRAQPKQTQGEHRFDLLPMLQCV
jgi:hypothetical protein